MSTAGIIIVGMLARRTLLSVRVGTWLPACEKRNLQKTLPFGLLSSTLGRKAAVITVDTPVIGKLSHQRVADRAFYVGMALAAVVTVFVGFSRTYFLRSQFQTEPLPLYLHLHGFVFTTWIAIFVAQTTLVAARRVDLHRRLGWAGAAVAALMVIMAVTAAILSGRRNVAAGYEDPALSFLTTPFFDIAVFLILTTAAIRYRRKPETHKRLMLLASINILDAAVSRWPLTIINTSPWAYFLVTDVFVVAAVGYDLASRRRIHPAYVWGGLLMLVGQFTRDLVGHTAAWHAIARLLIG